MTVSGPHLRDVNPMKTMARFRDHRSQLRKQPEPEALSADRLLGVIVEPEEQGVSASYHCDWRTVRTQVLEPCVPDLSTAQPVLRPGQIGARNPLARKGAHVGHDYLLGSSVHPDFPRVNPNPAGTKVFDNSKIIRHEHNLTTALPHSCPPLTPLLLT